MYIFIYIKERRKEKKKKEKKKKEKEKKKKRKRKDTGAGAGTGGTWPRKYLMTLEGLRHPSRGYAFIPLKHIPQLGPLTKWNQSMTNWKAWATWQ